MNAETLGAAWLSAVEAQLAAARAVDPTALSAATDDRIAVQDALLTLLESGSAADRRALGPVAARVRGLDLRIRACGGSVLHALETLLPAARPSTYTRHARIRENG